MRVAKVPEAVAGAWGSGPGRPCGHGKQRGKCSACREDRQTTMRRGNRATMWWP